jgi:hypothetical protein
LIRHVDISIAFGSMALGWAKCTNLCAFGVIVNDTSVVNVDAQLMKNGSASLSRVDERLVEMQNG